MASTVRAFGDEVRQLVEWYATRRANDEIRQLRAMVAHMEGAQVLQEGETSPYALAERAVQEYHLAGLGMSYDQMRRQGWTRQQFDTVHSLLVDLGVKDRHGNALTETLSEAEGLIDQAAGQGVVWPVGTDGRVRARAYIAG
jgi:hypothetical protein